MLDYCRARDRQAASEFACSAGRSGESLEDDHAERVAEQREYPQYFPKGIGIRM